MEEQKKKKNVWKIVLIVVAVILVIGAIGSQSEKGSDKQQPEQQSQKQEAPKQETPKQEAPKQAEEKQDAPKQQASGLEHGELLDLVENDGVVVIKAKIEPKGDNQGTINQNYYNVVHFIEDNDMEGVTEIQYWAVADMTSGKEEKAISFTVPEPLIKQIKEGKVVANQLGDHVTDLWMIASLKK